MIIATDNRAEIVKPAKAEKPVEKKPVSRKKAENK